MTTLQHAVGYGVLLLLAGLAGVLVLHEHDARVRAQAIAQGRADSLTRATVALAQLDRQRSQDSAAAVDSLARLSARVATSARRVTVLARQADSLVRLDSLRPALAMKDAIIGEQATQITALRADSGVLARRWLAAEAAATAWRQAADAARTQLAAALKRSAPRWVCVGGVGAAGGVNGLAAGLSATCGIRVL